MVREDGILFMLGPACSPMLEREACEDNVLAREACESPALDSDCPLGDCPLGGDADPARVGSRRANVAAAEGDEEDLSENVTPCEDDGFREDEAGCGGERLRGESLFSGTSSFEGFPSDLPDMMGKRDRLMILGLMGG